ncbi:NAD-dependent epimerase/dehydratase family protein [Knoellia sp. 3-2P3]|uniref:NAD-dependent epimerase/dehydratase family protein n=1 Tax=unclassified Knoellia TaxID=2618719 RepID=UPI0023DAD57F|nr:NAD-dependent epimerase/dehydratase family protein [Knoellia sp. 3-2P3]MDF2091298.1 NAD-dependent epimerase/dehydratase family protein [Knoellia sp. 3-2P3]
MGRFVVLGAGAVGQGTARELAGAGHEVQVVSRSGRGPQVAGVIAVAADAGDVDRLTALATGASAIVNALNPPKYTTWEKDWPPLAAAALGAAERTGAGLVTVSNLYGHGVVDGPMTETTPLRPNGRKGELRARMWQEALEAHQSGRVRVTELRASDYTGPGIGARMSMLHELVVRPVLRGRPAWLLVGRPDAPHTWTDVRDTARLAAPLATDDRSWGEAWHVPSAPARSMRQVATEVAALVGRDRVSVHGIPRGVVTGLGAVVPFLRELHETRHQFERPFVLDASHTSAVFGLQPTPWEQTLKETVAYLSGTAA